MMITVTMVIAETVTIYKSRVKLNCPGQRIIRIYFYPYSSVRVRVRRDNLNNNGKNYDDNT